MDKYLTVSETAEILRVPNRNIINMIKRGLLKGKCISPNPGRGRKVYLVKEKDLKEFME